jgi:ATP-dependent RNA helicase DDX51/DBP6
MCACAQVIDEADRLLRQSYQDWLPFVVAATAPLHQQPALEHSSAHASAYSGAQWQQRVVKFIASATLTRDPAKLERLGLHAPRCIAVGAADHRRAIALPTAVLAVSRPCMQGVAAPLAAGREAAVIMCHTC